MKKLLLSLLLMSLAMFPALGQVQGTRNGDLRSKTHPWFDVTNSAYGAKGDGVTQDAAAIQLAIDAIPAAGGTLYFPPGTYEINAALDFGDRAKVSIVGEGPGVSIIKITEGSTNGFYAINISPSASAVDHVTIKDLSIIDPDSSMHVGGDEESHGIVIFGVDVGTTPVSHVVIDNVYIEGMGDECVDIIRAKYVTITNSTFKSCMEQSSLAGGGVAVTSSTHVMISDNHIIDNYQWAAIIVEGPADPGDQDLSYIKIMNNMIDSPVHAKLGATLAGHGVGIQVANGAYEIDQISIVGNTVISPVGVGIFVVPTGGGSVRQFMVSNNQVLGGGTGPETGPGTYHGGIDVNTTAADNCVISDNQVHSWGVHNNDNTHIGIYVKSDYCSVTGNQTFETAGGGVYVVSVNSDSSIAGNADHGIGFCDDDGDLVFDNGENTKCNIDGDCTSPDTCLPRGVGIRLNGYGVISGNSVEERTQCIYTDESAVRTTTSDGLVTGNTVADCLINGIRCNGCIAMGNKVDESTTGIAFSGTNAEAHFNWMGNNTTQFSGTGTTGVQAADDAPLDLGDFQNLEDSATPTVAGGTLWRTVGTTTITDFLNGTEGQMIFVHFDTSVTVDFSTNSQLKGNGGVDFSAVQHDEMTCVRGGTPWYCVVSKTTGTDAATLDTIDSTGFAILAGQAGGQTIKGGTGTTDDLTLISNDATPGNIVLGDADLFNCDTIDTDAAGVMSCGTDAAGSGAWGALDPVVLDTTGDDVRVGPAGGPTTEPKFSVVGDLASQVQFAVSGHTAQTSDIMVVCVDDAWTADTGETCDERAFRVNSTGQVSINRDATVTGDLFFVKGAVVTDNPLVVEVDGAGFNQTAVTANVHVGDPITAGYPQIRLDQFASCDTGIACATTDSWICADTDKFIYACLNGTVTQLGSGSAQLTKTGIVLHPTTANDGFADAATATTWDIVSSTGAVRAQSIQDFDGPGSLWKVDSAGDASFTTVTTTGVSAPAVSFNDIDFTGIEAKIIGDANADNNGEISLQVETSAGVWTEGFRVESNSGVVTATLPSDTLVGTPGGPATAPKLSVVGDTAAQVQFAVSGHATQSSDIMVVCVDDAWTASAGEVCDERAFRVNPTGQVSINRDETVTGDLFFVRGETGYSFPLTVEPGGVGFGQQNPTANIHLGAPKTGQTQILFDPFTACDTAPVCASAGLEYMCADADDQKIYACSNGVLSAWGSGGGAATQITVADTTDTTTNVVLTGDPTGDQAPLTDGGLTYNATTAALTATTFVGALTGEASAVAAGVCGANLTYNAGACDAGSGTGDVTKVGTPVADQIGVWTGDGTLEGDTAFTFNATGDILTIGASGNLAFGAVTIFDDVAGATSLNNIDSIDATTETTLEGAIDLAGLQEKAHSSLTGVGTSDHHVQTPDEVGTLTTGDLCVNDGSSVNCTVNTEAELETALDSLDVVAVVTDDISTANLMTIISDEGSPGTYLNGNGTWSTPAGSGDVTKVGTPANNQVGVWTGDGTIEGDVDLTFDGTDLTVGGTVTSGDQTTAPGNLIQVYDNDVDLTPNPSCTDSGAAGTFTIVDNDESATDDYSLCDGTTEAMSVSSSAVVVAGTLSAGGNAVVDVGDVPTVLSNVTTMTDGQFCQGNAGGGFDCDVAGALADDDLSDDLITALSGVTTVTDGAFCQGGATSTMDCDVTELADGDVSNTLTSSLFVGSGSTTNAIDLATAEVAGTLPVGNGGTGAITLTDGGVLFGNTTGAVQASAVLTEGQLLIGDGTTEPAIAAMSGDATMASSGALTIAAAAVEPSMLANQVKSMVWPASQMSSDGTECTIASEVTINSGPKGYTVACPMTTSETDGFVYGQGISLPKGFDKTADVTFELSAYLTTDGGAGTWHGQIQIQCQGAGEIIDSTWGTAIGLDLTPEAGDVVNDVIKDTSAAVDTDTTGEDCAGEDMLFWRWLSCDTDATPTSGCTSSAGFENDMSLLSMKMIYTWNPDDS